MNRKNKYKRDDMFYLKKKQNKVQSKPSKFVKKKLQIKNLKIKFLSPRKLK